MGEWREAIDRRTVVVDVETTGLGPDDRVITLGAIMLDPAGERIEGRHLVFNPGRPSHPRARAVHGFDDRSLVWQDPFADHAAEIQDWLATADRLVAHNLAFDAAFIDAELRRAGLRGLQGQGWCTMEAHRTQRGGSARLDAVIGALGLARNTHLHGAMEDAWLALQVYLDQLGAYEAPVAGEWRALPIANWRSRPARASEAGEVDSIAELLMARQPPIRPVPGSAGDMIADEIEPEPGVEQSVYLDEITVGIRYRDASGAESTRTVRCHALERSDAGIYLSAECQLRHAHRAFRLDRILDVYDYTTGEIIGSAQAFFGPYMPMDWTSPHGEGAPDAPASRPSAEPFADAAKVLMYMAMEDGSLDPEEYRIIVDHCLERLRRTGRLDAQTEAFAAAWIRNHVPSHRAATIALGKLMDADDAGGEVASLLIDVMLADGHASDEEMRAARLLVDYMQRREQKAAR